MSRVSFRRWGRRPMGRFGQRRSVPDSHDAVLACRRQAPAVRAEGDAEKAAGWPAQGNEFLPRVTPSALEVLAVPLLGRRGRFPDTDRAVVCCRNNALSIRGEGNKRDHVSMPCKGRTLLT